MPTQLASLTALPILGSVFRLMCYVFLGSGSAQAESCCTTSCRDRVARSFAGKHADSGHSADRGQRSDSIESEFPDQDRISGSREEETPNAQWSKMFSRSVPALGFARCFF